MYNTLVRDVRPFEALEAGHVRIYVCGLTPSAEAHLGHARSFMFFDVVRRWLTFKGLRVTFVQNVTDIDDRSIAAAAREGVQWHEIVERYYASFKRSMHRLHVREPDHEPRATEYLQEIKAMIAELIERGHAYVVEDGVYYRVKSFERYGALSGRNVDELLVGARIAADEHKEDPLDFALWKFAKPGEPSWESPWGAGRPGWHIECSAMSHALLGAPFDIHGGGYDLIFPHHENEIAQSEAVLPAPPMANVWMHGGLLQFDGKKMSKSLGNFEPLSSVLDRYDPQAIRLLFLQTGYRKPMNFTEPSIEAARTGLGKVFAAYDLLRASGAPSSESAASSEVARQDGRLKLEESIARFSRALDEDFNTAGAVSVLFDLAKEGLAWRERGVASEAAAFMHEALEILGISPHERARVPVEAAPSSERVYDVDDGAFVVRSTSDAAAKIGAERFAALRGALDEIAESASDDAAWRASVRAALATASEPAGDAAVAHAIERAIEARYRAKNAKDFALADRVRDALRAAGVAITDMKGGASWNVDV